MFTVLFTARVVWNIFITANCHFEIPKLPTYSPIELRLNCSDKMDHKATRRRVH